MNKYNKLYSKPAVWGLESTEKYKKGDIVKIANRYGQEKKHVIHNLVLEKNDLFYYSITNYDHPTRAERKAEKYEKWANSAEAKSGQFYEKSQEGSDFLTLAEPIKIGHHSEKRHRALIERVNNAMENSIAMDEKAKSHQHKAEYWKEQAKKIDITMPESYEYYAKKLEEAKAHHKYLKENPEKREHAYSLTYAKKEVNNTEKLLARAEKLWK